MPELNFQIESAEAVRYSATPLLNLNARIKCADSRWRIHNVLLQCQIQMEPARRRYASNEQGKLQDLFGVPARWSQTLRPILWANSSVVVTAFQGETLADIPVPCTFDFNVAVTKYLYSLEDGEAPICVLFSGTVFYASEEGALQIAKIPWDREAHYRLPLRVWREMMDMHYPNTAWLCLRRDVFDQMYQYKVDRGIPTWDEALQTLLAASEEKDVRARA